MTTIYAGCVSLTQSMGGHRVADNSTSNDVNKGNNELQKHGKRNKCPLAPVLFIIFYKSAN